MDFCNAMGARFASALLCGLKRVVESRRMLELQRAFDSIGLTDDHHERGGKAFDGEVSREFVGIPDLAVFLFQALP